MKRMMVKRGYGKTIPGGTDGKRKGRIEGNAEKSEGGQAQAGAREDTLRNENACTIHWRLSTADARIKLKKLYPSFYGA
jgi:hypothetical protein